MADLGTAELASVLVVDDDENQRWMVQKYLQKHGFDVDVAKDGLDMRHCMAGKVFDIVLLDVTLPGEDGFSLARHLRERYQLGIIMLTASGDLLDRVLGLEIGADDYITKPFEPRELLARVKSVLRRTGKSNPVRDDQQQEKNENLVAFGSFTLDLELQELRDDMGKAVSITSMEFDLLRAFAENPGRVLTRDNLLSIAHKRDSDPFDRSVDIRIARVRRKIEVDHSKPQIIKTVRGAGYIFVSKSSEL